MKKGNNKSELTLLCLQLNYYRNNFNSAVTQLKNSVQNINSETKKIDVIILPEYWNGLQDLELVNKFAEKSLSILCKMALEKKVYIAGAHLVCKDSAVYNRCYVVNNKGEIAGFYDKKHPFGYERKRGLSAGNRELIFDLMGWKASCKICSDLWHTEDFIYLIKQNVDILFTPIMSVVTDFDYISYGKNIWFYLAITRAKEGCIALCVSDSAKGLITGNHYATGASCIVDPSIRFKNNELPFSSILTSIPEGKAGSCIKTISKADIINYRNYRKEAGLLE